MPYRMLFAVFNPQQTITTTTLFIKIKVKSLHMFGLKYCVMLLNNCFYISWSLTWVQGFCSANIWFESLFHRFLVKPPPYICIIQTLVPLHKMNLTDLFCHRCLSVHNYPNVSDAVALSMSSHIDSHSRAASSSESDMLWLR